MPVPQRTVEANEEFHLDLLTLVLVDGVRLHKLHRLLTDVGKGSYPPAKRYAPDRGGVLVQSGAHILEQFGTTQDTALDTLELPWKGSVEVNLVLKCRVYVRLAIALTLQYLSDTCIGEVVCPATVDDFIHRHGAAECSGRVFHLSELLVRKLYLLA